MSGLNLDDSEKMMFDHAATGYGAVIYGGDDTERVEAVQEELPTPHIIVDGRFITSSEDLCKRILLQTTEKTEEEIDKIHSLGSIEVSRAVNNSGSNILFYEFDSMEEDVQRSIAQLLKGIVEQSNWEGRIAFTCANGDALVKSNPDLTGRVRSFEL